MPPLSPQDIAFLTNAILDALEAVRDDDALRVDIQTDPVPIISFPHNKVHEGHMFQSSFKSPDGADIANDGTLGFRIAVGAIQAHFTFEPAAGGNAELELIEEPTITDDGTDLAAADMRRDSPSAHLTMVAVDPAVTGATGLRLVNQLLAGGTGGNAGGGNGRTGTEWILAPGKEYYLVLTNRAGNAQPMSCILQWYEEALTP